MGTRTKSTHPLTASTSHRQMSQVESVTMHCTIKAHELPEITDIIFDLLDTDKQSLASCALVCTDWALSARGRLFSTIRLRGRDSQRFLSFLRSTHATQSRKYIRELRWDEADGDSFDIETLCDVISNTPQVHTLHISFKDFKRRPTSYPFGQVKARLGQVKRLCIRYRLLLNKMENTVQPLLAFLTMFSLDSLELDSISAPSEADLVDDYRVGYTPLPAGEPFHVRSLTVVNGNARYHEAGLLSRLLSASHPTLESLTYTCHSAADVQALGGLLKRAGKRLRCLQLAIHTRHATGQISQNDWQKLRLECCSHLDTLHLPDFWNHPQQFASLFSILINQAPALRHITLGAIISSQAIQVDVSRVLWQSLEKWLQSLAQLDAITVDLRAMGSQPAQADFTRKTILANMASLAKSVGGEANYIEGWCQLRDIPERYAMNKPYYVFHDYSMCSNSL